MEGDTRVMNGVKRAPLKLSDYNGKFRSGGSSIELPRTFKLPQDRIPDVRDQGMVNSCVGFASTNIMQILNQIETGQRCRFSPGYVYGRCRGENDVYQGMYIGLTLEYLRKLGSCYESDFPDNLEMPEIMQKVRNRPDLDDKAEPYHIQGYEVYAEANVQELYKSVKQAVFGNQIPILGDIDCNGGSHAVCIIGWNDDTQEFIILNSWGEYYGDRGVGNIPYSDLHMAYLMIDAENSNKLMPFKDVTEDKWYYNAIKKAYNAGLMSGVSEDAFEPERPLTRAEMAQVLSNLCDKFDDIINSMK